MSELLHTLRLLSVAGLGNQRIRLLIRQFGSPSAVFDAGRDALSRVGFLDESILTDMKQDTHRRFAEKQLSDAEEQNVTIIPIWDASYPELLKKIHDPPVLLFVRGSGSFSQRSIAIVGMRTPSSYGRRMASHMAADLADQHIQVVSGMARGIDTCAHRGAMQGGGTTVAVLGCGVDVIYPPENNDLAGQILDQGLIVSEFPLHEEPIPSNFPKRNRIISGLSMGTLVIEAGIKSGALITAYLALEQGREVFALPGQVGYNTSRGTHRLIKEGAKLVETIDDIMDEIPGISRKKQNSQLSIAFEDFTEAEKRLWNHLSHEPRHIDQITSELGLTTSETLSILLSLELKNGVRQMSGMMFVRQQ
jgi:DNA processing protein